MWHKWQSMELQSASSVIQNKLFYSQLASQIEL